MDDLVEGMVRMMDNQEEFPGPVNLGNPEEYTVLELAEKVLKQTKSYSRIVFAPLPQDDPVRRNPVITLANEKLNWMPAISLDQGLEKTIRYFERIL